VERSVVEESTGATERQRYGDSWPTISNSRRRWKTASPAPQSSKANQTLALSFFFNEALRFDGQTHVDGKH